jgi:putative two-component system response regulator
MPSDFDIDDELRGARILVVDDIPANIEVLTETLLRGGYALVDSAADPLLGLEMALAGTYDLVLLDMRMPGMDGHEFMHRLRQTFDRDRLPVMVITGQTDDDTKRKALAAGVHDFITKPFVLWELLHRVRNTLELHVHHRRVREVNAVLELRVMERTQELEETRKEVIRRLASAGEFRDNETGQHVVRMSQFAHQLALAAGLSSRDAAMIRDAAPLHDIGKIGIPDKILLKPGRLDRDEWEIMKRHAAIGGAILAGSGFALLDLARTIALTHHEQWDGSGYPSGLKGEEIPIAGRLTAVADVFDALTSERPYKPVWPVEQALDFLKDRAGQHFDPRLIALFERELPAILEIKERFRDTADDDGHPLMRLGVPS